ncbi:MAG: acyl-CoA thioesterase [Halioglobus sp.]|nr:acyl-CoA thioesterase [Halioglobus sp.]
MIRSYASASIELEIPFHDIDIMGIAWHGHYAKYLEIARGVLLDSINYNVIEMRESGYAWPVIEMKIRYAGALTMHQRIRVHADLVEYENRLKISYRIFDSETNRRLTKAYTIQVALEIATNEMLYASPPVLLGKLGL